MNISEDQLYEDMLKSGEVAPLSESKYLYEDMLYTSDFHIKNSMYNTSHCDLWA